MYNSIGDEFENEVKMKMELQQNVLTPKQSLAQGLGNSVGAGVNQLAKTLIFQFNNNRYERVYVIHP